MAADVSTLYCNTAKEDKHILCVNSPGALGGLGVLICSCFKDCKIMWSKQPCCLRRSQMETLSLVAHALGLEIYVSVLNKNGPHRVYSRKQLDKCTMEVVVWGVMQCQLSFCAADRAYGA